VCSAVKMNPAVRRLLVERTNMYVVGDCSGITEVGGGSIGLVTVSCSIPAMRRRWVAVGR
jgi:hypothetical protein